MIGQRMLAASLLVLAIATHHALAANFVFGPNTKVVADVWDAENQLILQPSGRLIVTGGDNIYEIVRSGSTYTKIPLMSGPGYYLGLSQVNNTLYALQSVPGCSTNESATTNFLLSAPIVDGKQLVFSKIYAIQSFTLPNGMAFYDNKFYIADTAYTGSGKIATLALSPSDPNVITAQVTFLTTAQAEAPNGVKIFNNTLYYSSLGTVKSVLLTQSPPKPVALFTLDTVLDDMNLLNVVGYPNTLLMVCNYLEGEIVLWDLTESKQVYKTRLEGFSGPSSLQMTGGALGFPLDSVLLTDKGVVCSHTATGNFLSYFTIVYQ